MFIYSKCLGVYKHFAIRHTVSVYSLLSSLQGSTVMEEAKPVKSEKARRSYVGVLKKKPGKTSLAGASRTKGTKHKAKADTVETSTRKTTKQKDEKIVKKTKRIRTGNEAEDSEAENKLEATETAKTKDPETAKNTQETRTVKKIKQNTVKLDISAGTSKMKVQKKKSKTGKNIQKNEVNDKKPKIREDVYEAITINGEPRKGATSQAIKKYIFSKWGIENEDASHERINNRINKFLRQAVENGDLARPATRKGAAPMPSATGRFMLAKKIKSKESKKPKTDEDNESNE